MLSMAEEEGEEETTGLSSTKMSMKSAARVQDATMNSLAKAKKGDILVA